MVRRIQTFAIPILLLVSLVAGVAVDRAMSQRTRPAERAQELKRRGRLVDAERAMLEAARQRPASLPAIVELLEIHRVTAFMTLRRHSLGREDPETPAGAPVGDEQIEQVLAAPDLPPDVALLARWWAHVIRHEDTEESRSAVVAAAGAARPIPWANHLLGRHDQLRDDDEEAAEHYAREATEFDDRREDADEACHQWIEAEAWDRLSSALARPQFARQVSPSVRLQEAQRRGDWRTVARLFIPAEYEDVTLTILLLALVAALVWFAVCAEMGLLRQRPAFRAPLYLAAVVLGVGSAQLALAVAMLEEHLHFTEKGEPALDVIYYVVGVGLREELAKALWLLPLVPVVLKWGRRREAFACGALVGLGFAAEENIAYLHAGLSTALTRFVTANFLHVCTTGLVAVAIDDYFRGREREPGQLSRTMMLVVLAHGMYDFFLSSGAVSGYSFFSMLVFVLLTRHFTDVLRSLPGREGPLRQWFGAGLAAVTGASFVYGCALVGPGPAGAALVQGAFGVAIVIYMFFRELGSI